MCKFKIIISTIVTIKRTEPQIFKFYYIRSPHDSNNLKKCTENILFNLEYYIYKIKILTNNDFFVMETKVITKNIKCVKF